MKKNNLYNQVRDIRNLRKAWGRVRQNATSSQSNTIKQQALEFDTEIDKHLSRIQTQLRKKKYTFKPAIGIAKEDKPGKKRPIVIACIEDRIVQRAILQTLQSIPSLKSLIETPTSCGGIQARSVRYAVTMAHEKIIDDGQYYIRSDIQGFFTKIPKNIVLDEITKHSSDDDFNELIRNSIDVILSNTNELGRDFKLFPTADIGVAQGSCLSPLLGNILLHEFDKALNSEDILCLRYIDDFLLLGPSRKSVNAKLKKGNKILNELGLEAYDPQYNTDKAAHGKSSRGIIFLGCDIRPNSITPMKAARKRLLEKVKTRLNRSKISLRTSPVKDPLREHSFVESLANVSHIVKAWGNQYQFCNNEQVLTQLDEKISHEIKEYVSFYTDQTRKLESTDLLSRRRLLGVHALVDSKKDPIVSTKK